MKRIVARVMLFASCAGGVLFAQEASARVLELSAGEHHTCAVLDTGEVRCWGVGVSGRLGYGNSNDIGDDETPLSAGSVNIGGPVAHVSAGVSHTCAILRTGEVRCWGSGERGKLGYGNTNDIGDDETPASAGSVSIAGEAIQLALGASHTCALLEGGDVRCWGASRTLGLPNLASDVGDDELPSSLSPLELGGKAVQIAAGRNHTCALLDTGKLRCWGAGGQGRLGYGNRENVGFHQTPAAAGDVPVGERVLEVVAGPTHTCARVEGGRVRCWGVGARGALGYGNVRDVGDQLPASAAGDVNVGAAVLQLAAGGYDSRSHSCALLATGAVRCWGAGAQGQLGHGDTRDIGDDEAPASAGDIELGGKAIQISAGGNRSCALLTDGGLRCWGSSPQGQLGYANTQTVGAESAPAAAGFVALEVPRTEPSTRGSWLWGGLLAVAVTGLALRGRRRRALHATS